MPSDSERGYLDIFDDFEATTIGTGTAAGVRWFNSADSSDTAFVATAIEGGIARGVLTTTDNNMIELSHGLLMFRGQDGFVMFEARAQLNDVTNVAFNIGFNDDALDDSNSLPVELATATFTSNAGTYYGFVYDTDATNDDVHAFWVDDDNDTSDAIADLRFSDIAPINAEYFTARVAGYDRGSAASGLRTKYTFFKDSTPPRHAEKVINSNVDRDVLLTAYTGWENRSGTTHTADIDYFHIVASRAS